MISSALILTVAIAGQLPTSFGPPAKSTPQQVHPTIQQAPSKNLPEQIQPTPQQQSYAPTTSYSYSQMRYSVQAAAPCNTCDSMVAYGASRAQVYQAPVRAKFKQKMKFKGGGKARGFFGGRCGGC